MELRELEISTKLITSMNNNIALNHYKEIDGIKYNLISNTELINIVKDFITSVPKHETVEQWEKRTGQIYPDDGPVWIQHRKASGVTGKIKKMVGTFGLRLFREVKYVEGLKIVANEHGKPEETL